MPVFSLILRRMRPLLLTSLLAVACAHAPASLQKANMAQERVATTDTPPQAKIAANGTQEFVGNGNECELSWGPAEIAHQVVSTTDELRSTLVNAHLARFSANGEEVNVEREEDTGAVTTEGDYVLMRHAQLELEGHTHLYVGLGVYELRRCSSGAHAARVVTEREESLRIELAQTYSEDVYVCFDEDGEEVLPETVDDSHCMSGCVNGTQGVHVWTLDANTGVPLRHIAVREKDNSTDVDVPPPRITFEGGEVIVEACGRRITGIDL